MAILVLPDPGNLACRRDHFVTTCSAIQSCFYASHRPAGACHVSVRGLSGFCWLASAARRGGARLRERVFLSTAAGCRKMPVPIVTKTGTNKTGCPRGTFRAGIRQTKRFPGLKSCGVLRANPPRCGHAAVKSPGEGRFCRRIGAHDNPVVTPL